MSLTTKKILLSIVSFALALSVAFAVVSFVQNGSKPAFAETGKTVVEWTAGTPNGKDFVDNGDGTVTVTDAYAAVQQIKGDAYNAYKNIVKKTIVITNLVKQGVSGNHGVSIGIYNGSNSAYGANKYAWTNPRVNIFDSCIQINNGWGDGSSQSYSDNVFAYSYNDEPYTLQNNVPYTIYFGIENVDVEGELYVEIYAKLTDVTGQITYVEQTHTLKAMNTLPKDFKDQMNVRVRTGARSYTESTDPYYVKEFKVSTAKTYTLDALEHDEDISYYWLSNYVTDNKVGKEATAASCTTLTKDKQFYTPDFDNRWTFKLVVDNTYGFFTTETYKNAAGTKTYNAGALRIGLGQRYSDIGFKFDYYRDKITLSCANSTLGSKSFNFELDPTKEYKVSIVVRDVRDDQGTLVYRMPVVDVVEIGNETHKITASMLINFLIVYGDKDETTKPGSEILPKHMRLCNGEDFNSLAGSSLCETGDGCGFSLVSLEPWKYVTIGNQTDKINTANITLPEITDSSKVFVGYLCSADNQIYQPGKVNFASYLGKNITFTAIYNNKVIIKDIAGNELSATAVENSFEFPVYNGTKTFVAYKGADGKLYKEGESVEISDNAAFTLIDADVQILDDVKIRLSNDQLGGLRFAVKILTADLNALQSANVAFKLTIDGVEVQLASPVQDGAYTIAYFAKTDIEFTKFNTDIDAKIIISYESGDVVVLTASANICEIASYLASRNATAITNGQALYNKTAAQMLHKYLSALED